MPYPEEASAVEMVNRSSTNCSNCSSTMELRINENGISGSLK